MDEVVWSKKSITNLKRIWDFYAHTLETISGARSVVNGIKKIGDSLTITAQHQTEESLKPNQYRAIYKHFKIIYTVKNNRVLILQIFDARQSPSKFKS